MIRLLRVCLDIFLKIKGYYPDLFNAILLVANQETVVEILSFLKQIAPKTTKPTLQPLGDRKDLSKSTTDLFYLQEKVRILALVRSRVNATMLEWLQFIGII